MSASQNKKARQEERKGGFPDAKAQQQREEQAKKRRNRIIGAVASVVVVLLIIGSFVVNSDYFYTRTAAITIGDTEYTTAEYNYFYFSAYYSFQEQLGDAASSVIDTDRPLDEQEYVDGQTFDDLFRESAIESMTELTVLYDEAVAAGTVVSEERMADVDTQIAEIETYASIYGMTTEQFLTQNYGKGFDLDTLRSLLEMGVMVEEFAQQKLDSYEYTDDELKAEYDANKDSYDIFTYRVYYVGNGEDAEAAAATADAIAAAETGEEFADLVYENAPEDSRSSYEDPDSTLYVSSGSTLDSYDYGEWLKDPSRTEQETAVIESSSGEGRFVVMFLGRDDNDYATVDVRHILIEVQADEDGEYTDEAREEALTRIEEIRDEFEAGDRTEESFAALANEYSEDPGSNTTGGLYENIAHSQMVVPFEEFCFAKHEPGDIGIVYAESSNYAGYHLIYFVGENMNYCDYIADTTMRTADYTEWLDGLKSACTVETHYSLRFAG